MKTAEIMRLSMGAGPVEKPWLVGITDYDGDTPGWSGNSWHATHAEALAHALAEIGLTGFKISRTHEGCSDCDRMAREAYRTAREHGTDTWLSITTSDDGRGHTAIYLAEVGFVPEEE